MLLERRKFWFKFDPGPGAPPLFFHFWKGKGGPGTWIELEPKFYILFRHIAKLNSCAQLVRC